MFSTCDLFASPDLSEVCDQTLTTPMSLKWNISQPSFSNYWLIAKSSQCVFMSKFTGSTEQNRIRITEKTPI